VTRRASALTVTDQFCGAGGSSLGARALGMDVRLAMNHWSRAVETHNENFPDTDHVCADISSTDPRRYPSTDILITSPECTNHTSAKGVRRPTNQTSLFGEAIADEAAERSRATMWDVPRFAERHQYALIIVENVVEARQWLLFDNWLGTMHTLGYDQKAVYLNSMHAGPVPQSRDRMYLVFWRRGNPKPNLDLQPLAHCSPCAQDVHAVQAWKRIGRPYGRYRAQYIYVCPHCARTVEPLTRPAADAIDWTLPSVRIGDRERPLASKTLARIEAGIAKFWPASLVQVNHAASRNGADHHRTSSLHSPLPTLTAKLGLGLAQAPFIAELRGGGSEARSVTDPLATVCASGTHHGLVQPPRGVVVSNYSPGWTRDADAAPLGSLTTQDHHSLLQPPRGFLSPYYGTSTPAPLDAPMPTVTTRDRCGLVQASTDAPAIDDCSFRMLDPAELGRAMAFPEDYVVTGNKSERVRQYGNAVTPPAMQLILQRCLATLQ
jgi:DNA (cytosine-5)-methyltransferase 1